MNGKSRTVVAVGIASFLHLIGFFLYLRFCVPIAPESSENAITISFFGESVLLMRESIHRKQVLFPTSSPSHHRTSMSVALLQNSLTLPAAPRAPHAVSLALEPDSRWNEMSLDLHGDNLGIESTIRREFVTGKLRASHAQKPFSPIGRSLGKSVVSPDSEPTDPGRPRIFVSDSAEDPVMDSRVDVPYDKTDTNKIDVIFIISCRGEMRSYFEYAIAVVEREIQKYQDAEKDCRAGIIKSRFSRINGPVHQIEYWPPSSELDRIVEIARDTRNLKIFSQDILLNAIRYALDRCSLRPKALRKIVAIGNDIPICGGYSPLSIIELCSKERVMLDIHGADDRIGPLLARETGGEWFSALANPRDRKLLESVHIESSEWKVQYTIDSVVEGKFTD